VMSRVPQGWWRCCFPPDPRFNSKQENMATQT
jgi:hypothetical protein